MYRSRNCGNQPAQAATSCPVDWGLTANARRHCPGGTQCQKISPAPVGQKTRTTQDRNYYMPSNLGEAMIRLLDHSSNEGLAILSQVLRKGEHALGNLWTGQLSQQSRSGPPRGKYGPSRPRCTVPSCPAE